MSNRGLTIYRGVLDLELEDAIETPPFVPDLHDVVCEDLTDLLVELELVRRWRPSPEIDRHVRTVRDVVVELRRLLSELHPGEPADTIGLVSTLAPGVGIAVTRQGEARPTDD